MTQMTGSPLSWVLFNVFVLLMLALDLGVFHRKAHVVRFKEAIAWTCVWVTLALIFNAGIWLFAGQRPALEFLTGYLIEKSLSVDNIFVFLMLFSFFKIPAAHQHKVLFWGILGAIVMRAAFIFAGLTLIAKFHWIIYVFGSFLILTGIKMAVRKDTEFHPERNPILNFLKEKVKVSSNVESGKFFVREKNRTMPTVMFICLLFVEASDLIFAVDSIPAILAVSSDPFIVYTSNVFAILGLRSLYFALARFAELFEYLHYGLAGVLVFVGLKMVTSDIYKIPPGIALGVIVVILGISIVVSIKKGHKNGAQLQEHD